MAGAPRRLCPRAAVQHGARGRVPGSGGGSHILNVGVPMVGDFTGVPCAGGGSAELGRGTGVDVMVAACCQAPCPAAWLPGLWRLQAVCVLLPPALRSPCCLDLQPGQFAAGSGQPWVWQL